MRNIFLLFLLISSFSLLFWLYWCSGSGRPEHFQINTHLPFNSFSFQASINPLVLPCSAKPGPEILIIVTSYVGHIEVRSAHRRAMPPDYLEKLNAARIFLLAQIPHTEKYITQDAVKAESDRFGDILQGSFIEHYRNLTYKHIMGLQWAAKECNSTTFILKVDDDTVFNLQKIKHILLQYQHADVKNFLLGYMFNDSRPKRQRNNKWYVSEQEYPSSDYPPYVSGWLYATTPSVAARLTAAAMYHPYFWIDDILITGILTNALSIKLIDLHPYDIWLEYYELLECCLRDMVVKNIYCDYAVGPNGGRNNLILEFNDAVRVCERRGNCTVRSQEQDLRKTCVVDRERTVFGRGESEIRPVML